METENTLTCQNPSCKKPFPNPLKTLNLQANPNETYFACPFCLTKVEGYEVQSRKDDKTSHKKDESKKSDAVLKNAVAFDKEPTCQHKMGYLSERSNKEQIPDECFVCKDIVDCMLKKVQ